MACCLQFSFSFSVAVIYLLSLEGIVSISVLLTTCFSHSLLPLTPGLEQHQPLERNFQNGGDSASSTTTPPRQGIISLGWQAPADAGTFKSKVLAGLQGTVTCASSHPRHVTGSLGLRLAGEKSEGFRRHGWVEIGVGVDKYRRCDGSILDDT